MDIDYRQELDEIKELLKKMKTRIDQLEATVPDATAQLETYIYHSAQLDNVPSTQACNLGFDILK